MTDHGQDFGYLDAPSPLEKLVAGFVNIYVGRWVARELGAPEWAGAVVAAVGMAAAADPTVSPRFRSVGRLVSAPGNLLVQTLRDRAVPYIADNLGAAVGGVDADNVIDIDARQE